MKKLNVFDKFLFLINSLVAALLIITYIIPYIDPEKFSTIAVLSLGYPAILAINVCFVIIWIVKLKPQFLLSLIIIGFGFHHTQSLFSFHTSKKNETLSDLSILTYNVRQFNKYNWIKNPNIKKDICDFINNKKADILCIQEYTNTTKLDLQFSHKYEVRKGSSGLAIYSNFPSIKSGSLNLKGTSNNIIFVDVKIKGKIYRIYNIHLQSFSLDTHKEYYGNSTNTALFKRFKGVFKQQAQQIKKLKKHIANCPHQTILAGDFNNTAFSWNYKQIMDGRKDAFVEAGTAFGKSYNYILPFRIDFILPEEDMIVNSFTSYKVNLSDHYPIMAKIILNN